MKAKRLTNMLIFNVGDAILHHQLQKNMNTPTLFDLYELIIYTRLEVYEQVPEELWRCDELIIEELMLQTLVENIKEQFTVDNYPILQYSYGVIQQHALELLQDLPDVLFHFIDSYVRQNSCSLSLWNRLVIHRRSDAFIIAYDSV